jgi:NAD(P)-dependent dehydrogenase (short-subunit alcohol dehydrogenase family)
VAVNDYRAERAEAAAGQIREQGGTAIGAQADVTDAAAAEAMVTRVADELGQVTILVNNAGNSGVDPAAVGTTPFWESDPAAWEPFLPVNPVRRTGLLPRRHPRHDQRRARTADHHHQRRRPRRRGRPDARTPACQGELSPVVHSNRPDAGRDTDQLT